MPYSARPHILAEASLQQLEKLKPNLAILPWGATEGHGTHLPHATDNYQAVALAEAAAEHANRQGARCIVLPLLPYGNDNMQLRQIATITMRTRTQQAVLTDIAESLARQGIDRLVILNYHGGNDFRQLIRDVMLDIPIFIVQMNGYGLCPELDEQLLEGRRGDHAEETETSLMLHLFPDLVAPRKTWGTGETTPSKLPAVSTTPGIWVARDWKALSKDTGVGDPTYATAEKGRKWLQAMTAAAVPVLVQLSKAKNGDFPYIVRKK